MKTVAVLLTAGLLSGCAAGFPFSNVGGKAEYEYIGCHVVTEDATQAPYQMGPFGIHTRYVGNRVFFKQKNADGTVDTTKLEKC